MAGQDHKRDIEFSDVTDMENKVGSSSDQPFRSGRAQALIHVSCCRSFDTSTSDSGVRVSFSWLVLQGVETPWSTFQASRS